MTSSQADKRPHYLIVGAGVAGCNVAYELSKQDVLVTLIDAGKIGERGASAVPVALLNPHRGRTARASELDKAGLTSMWCLVEELEALGLDHGVHHTSVVRIASNERQQREWQKLDRVIWLDNMPAVYHAPFGGIFIEPAGWLEPSLFLNVLVNVAKQRGVKVIENCELVNVERVSGIRGSTSSTESFQVSVKTPTSGTRNLEPDFIILCTGASKISGLSLPSLEFLSGDVIGLEADLTLPYPLAGAIYGAQKKRLVYMGGNHRQHGQDDPTAAQQLQRASSWFIPALKDAKVVSQWTGVRAKQEDNQPLIAELQPRLFFFGALGGRGFLCANYLAKQLVSKVQGKA
jgi:glycine/D-amino acid oxidase-like deaminating enzyme